MGRICGNNEAETTQHLLHGNVYLHINKWPKFVQGLGSDILRGSSRRRHLKVGPKREIWAIEGLLKMSIMGQAIDP